MWQRALSEMRSEVGVALPAEVNACTGCGAIRELLDTVSLYLFAGRYSSDSL